MIVIKFYDIVPSKQERYLMNIPEVNDPVRREKKIQLLGNNLSEMLYYARNDRERKEVEKLIWQQVKLREKQGFNPVMVVAGVKAGVTKLRNLAKGIRPSFPSQTSEKSD
jgi:hypothetical protein